MSTDPSAGQPRTSGKYSHRTSTEPKVALTPRQFPVGARVCGEGTFGFVKDGDRTAGYVPVDDGGSMTVFIRERHLTNLDELADAVMPALEKQYASNEAFGPESAQQTMTILNQLAADRADRSGHLAYVEALCALGSHDALPDYFESAARMLDGSDHLPDQPDAYSPKRASRLARHFTGRASEEAQNGSLVEAAMYADVAVIFAGGPEAAGTKDRILMVRRLRNGNGNPDEFLDEVFAGNFDARHDKPHTYMA